MTSQYNYGIRCFQGVLMWANFVIMCCGIALMAMCIFFIYDREHLHDLVYETGSNSIWSAAWIGLFTGFALFCVAALGMYAIGKTKKTLILVYIILMLIVFAFEMASAITAATHKDWFVPNLFLKQMLQYYNKGLPQNVTAETDKIQTVTNTWNRVMTQNHCCGINGPLDWVMYNSSFRQQYTETEYPWPRACCQLDAMGGILSLPGCTIGLSPYLFTTGCYNYIVGPITTQGLAISWFGFAILCWVFFVLLGMMFYYARFA